MDLLCSLMFFQVSLVNFIIAKYLLQLVSLRFWRIGLPYAVSQAGFVTGLVSLIVLCVVTDWTIRLIVVNAKLSGRNSYIEIMNSCFGPSGRAAVSFFQFAFAFGGMSSTSYVSRNSI